jgi:DNA anti-recombination protein RmuC
MFTKFLLTILRKYWIHIIALLGIVFFIFHYIGLKNEIKKLQEININLKVEISTLQGQLEGCQEANEIFQQEIQKFNQAISKWSEASQQQLRQFESLKTRIAASQATSALRIKQILENPNKPQTCEQAIQYLVSIGKQINKESPK